MNGIDANGRALFPIVPYFVYHNMSSADADAIVAYLRLAPRGHYPDPAAQLRVCESRAAYCRRSRPNPTLATTDADYASAVRGKYLAGSVGARIECHSPDAQGPVPRGTTKLFGGGQTYPAASLGLPTPPFPALIVSANITPHATGLQGWTAGPIVAAMKQGVDKIGAPLCPPMPFGPTGAFGHMTDADALDIANYVLHLPPIANDIGPSCHAQVAAAMSDAGARDAAVDSGADASH